MALPQAPVAERPVALPPSAESAAMPDQPIQSLTHDDFLVSISNGRRSLREACVELHEIISITRENERSGADACSRVDSAGHRVVCATSRHDLSMLS
jgi:hypothetical protein